MKYINKFSDNTAYNTYLEDGNIPTPNLFMIHGENKVKKKLKVSNGKNTYLTFEAIESGIFTFTANGSNSLLYSIDNGQTWTSGVNTPTIAAGDKVLWKGNCIVAPNTYAIGRFSSTGKFNVSGNILSLIYGDEYKGKYKIDNTSSSYKWVFNKLFYNTKIVNAKDLLLIADILSDNCYYSLFEKCSLLITAPALPAMTLANYCYSSMFSGCSALTSAPALPATTLTI